jgi:hypothetical protein
MDICMVLRKKWVKDGEGGARLYEYLCVAFVSYENFVSWIQSHFTSRVCLWWKLYGSGCVHVKIVE